MWKYHIEGGVEYMVPLTALFLVNIGFMVYALTRGGQGKPVPTLAQQAIKQIGGLALAWGVFSTIVALFQIFGALSQLKEAPPLAMIMGGLKVGFITALYGMIIFLISMVAHFVLRVVRRNVAPD